MHVLFLFLALALAPGASSQVRGDTLVVLPHVEVSAIRGTLTPDNLVSRRTVLSRETLQTSGARTLSEAMATVPGAFIRAYGPGGLATLSLRGMGASQTAVLLDGLRLNDPQLGQIDLNLIPVASLDRVEVVSGGASVWQGSDAMAGAVHLTSRIPHGTQAEVQAGSGAFGYRTGHLHLAHSGVSLSAWHLSEQGNFPYTNTALFPAQRVRREGAARMLSGISARYATPHTTIGLWLSDAERELPGVASTRVDSALQRDVWQRAWLAHRRSAGTSLLQFRMGFHRGQLRYQNPLQKIDDTGQTQVLQVEADVLHPLPSGLFSAGWASSVASATHPSLADAPHEGRSSGFLALEHRIGATTFSPALRVERIALEENVRWVATPRLSIHRHPATASISRVYRTPTFNDRFWQPGGNPSLKPEAGWTYDAGLRSRLLRHPVHVSVFAHRLTNQIVWMPGTRGWSPVNVQRTFGRGIEASISSAPDSRGMGFRAHYQLSRHTDDTPGAPTQGKPLRYVPQESGGMAVYRAGWLRPELEVRYTGKRFVTADASQSLPAYLTVYAILSAEVTSRISARLHIENLFDHAYEVLEGYPMPGRHARISLHVSL